jgi:DNA replication protein DnaC
MLCVRPQEAAANRLSHGEFLELILLDEINVRQQRRIARRTVVAEFTSLKNLEDVDWRFNPSISRNDIFEPAACYFDHQASDVLFVGLPAVGRTHLTQAIGYARWVSFFAPQRRSWTKPSTLVSGRSALFEVGYRCGRQRAT